jgi:hypothetical protein
MINEKDFQQVHVETRLNAMESALLGAIDRINTIRARVETVNTQIIGNYESRGELVPTSDNDITSHPGSMVCLEAAVTRLHDALTELEVAQDALKKASIVA